MSTDHSKVAIALGGGGARGYAHIGVLEELAARDYQVVRVAGTSMGAVVGALFASGHRYFALAILCGTGLAFYVLCAFALGAFRLSDFKAGLSRQR